MLSKGYPRYPLSPPSLPQRQTRTFATMSGIGFENEAQTLREKTFIITEDISLKI